jgi:hypothetical protein
MAKYYFTLLVFFTCLFCNANLVEVKDDQQIPSNRKLKILVYSPSVSWSHARFLGRIADTLVEAGHDVVSRPSDG